jgi:hypothetical protein
LEGFDGTTEQLVGARDLPLAAYGDHVKAFARIDGCRVERVRQHVVISRDGYPDHASIPAHKEVSRPLLQAQLQRLGISNEEYIAAFKKKATRSKRK